jgi:hypothetical protein
MGNHMTDNTAILTADTSGEFTMDDYADAELAAEISSFDPVTAPGPATLKGTYQFPGEVPVTALPPHLREPILAAVATVATVAPSEREAVQRRMVLEAAQQNSLNLRVNAGLGSDANPYQREFFAIAKDQQRLHAESIDLTTRLAEVVRWEPEFDAKGEPLYDRATGQQKLKPVEKVQGPARKVMEDRLREIGAHGAALEREAPRRLQRALRDAVKAVKACRELVEDNGAATVLADKMVREDRVRKMAEGRAKARLSGTVL